jgi:hypothetical protein
MMPISAFTNIGSLYSISKLGKVPDVLLNKPPAQQEMRGVRMVTRLKADANYTSVLELE